MYMLWVPVQKNATPTENPPKPQSKINKKMCIKNRTHAPAVPPHVLVVETKSRAVPAVSKAFLIKASLR
jgi:hypothetical protein